MRDNIMEAREQAMAQWNANPCGALESDVYDAAYFDRGRERTLQSAILAT